MYITFFSFVVSLPSSGVSMPFSFPLSDSFPLFSFLIILHPPKRVISTEDQIDSAFSGVQRTRGL